MQRSISTFLKDKFNTRSLEALAFYLGAHGIAPETVTDRIDAQFIQQTSDEKQKPLRELHALEAKRERVKRERPEAEAAWLRVKKELGDTPPPFFHAALMAVFAAFALLLDTLFIAPTMDILNIAHPVLQFIAATGIAALCTVYFELAGILYLASEKSLPKRITAIIAAVIGALSLFAWGLLRGYQLRFAAELAGNPLGEFLSAHPLLASVFYIFITLATPLIGATAILYGWKEFQRARAWRRTRSKFERLRTDEIELSRLIQAEEQSLKEFDRRKEAECREWKAVFAEYYKRGEQNGARRETFLSVIRKTAIGVLCASPLALLIPMSLFPAQLGVVAVASLAAFAYFNHQRLHPNHERYLKRENTRFAVIPDGDTPHELQAQPQRLLTKGD